MAITLTYSGRSDGWLCDTDGPSYNVDVLIDFFHEDNRTKISLTDEATGIRITANADALFSYLTRVL